MVSPSLREALEEAGVPIKESGRVNGQRLSLKTLPNGTKYVEVDTDQHIFDGKNESDYGKIAREYIKEHFRNRVIGNEVKAYVKREGEQEYTTPAKHGMARDLYAAKMRSATELGNLLDAGKYIGEFDDDGRHGVDKRHYSPTEKWYRYKVLYKVENRFFQGETVIKKIARGCNSMT